MSDYQATVPLQPQPEPVFAQPKKKKRGWLWTLLALLIVAALIVGGEFWARNQVGNTVRDQASTVLGLASDAPIEVQTSGSVLWQVVRGNLTTLSGSAQDVPLGPINGDLSVRASGVPIRGGGPIAAIDGTITVDQAEFITLLNEQSIPVDNVTIENGELTGTASFDVLGLALPVSITLALSVEQGDLMVTPVVLKAGSIEVVGDELREMLGGLGTSLLGPYRVCIAEHLPKAVTVTGVALAEGNATVDITVDGNVAVDDSLRQVGECATP